MSELFRTGLVIVASPLPADFEGDPQQFFEAFVERLEIKSPVGTNFFIVGDVEPETNLGPWLKDGNKWYVFDTTEARYVPVDISDSLPQFFVISSTEPAAPGTDDALIWLQIAGDRAIGWKFWTGTQWRPGGNISPSGGTADRPSDPIDFEQFFDTDINCLLHWERGSWRTVSGTPGDVKYVTTNTLTAALTSNPGWSYLAESTQSWRGRSLAIASKDPGGSPESSFIVDSGITQRASKDEVGTETVILDSTQIEQHTHLVGALTALNSDNNAYFHRVDNGDTLTAPAIIPPNHAEVRGDHSTNGTKTGALPATGAGTMLITSRQLSLASAANYTAAAAAHNNLPPTLYLWALVKD